MDVQKCVNSQMYHFNIEKRLPGVGEALDFIILSYNGCYSALEKIVVFVSSVPKVSP